YGTLPPLISLSWATLARRYPLSGRRSAPTTDSATWWPTPAAASAARMLRVDVSKNSSAAAAANDGAVDTSTPPWVPLSASASPSPVRVLTPDEGDAETASWPRSRNRGINFFPMSPLPPITTIFMLNLLVGRPGSGLLIDLRHRPARMARVHSYFLSFSGMTMSLTSPGWSTTARMRVLPFLLGFLDTRCRQPVGS